ncbi:hypothetical protein EGW08_018578 [Elysia chlorotica]|uniref:Uncharacterized protein n=1 Tax=Elysia chlorotica TaxID=188477 RepID=A0A3S1B181_ELYCH|nr:hypothetical protein EGW08_018578 [Elysia chlorotica]
MEETFFVFAIQIIGALVLTKLDKARLIKLIVDSSGVRRQDILEVRPTRTRVTFAARPTNRTKAVADTTKNGPKRSHFGAFQTVLSLLTNKSVSMTPDRLAPPSSAPLPRPGGTRNTARTSTPGYIAPATIPPHIPGPRSGGPTWASRVSSRVPSPDHPAHSIRPEGQNNSPPLPSHPGVSRPDNARRSQQPNHTARANRPPLLPDPPLSRHLHPGHAKMTRASSYRLPRPAHRPPPVITPLASKETNSTPLPSLLDLKLSPPRNGPWPKEQNRKTKEKGERHNKKDMATNTEKQTTDADTETRTQTGQAMTREVYIQFKALHVHAALNDLIRCSPLKRITGELMLLQMHIQKASEEILYYTPPSRLRKIITKGPRADCDCLKDLESSLSCPPSELTPTPEIPPPTDADPISSPEASPPASPYPSSDEHDTSSAESTPPTSPRKSRPRARDPTPPPHVDREVFLERPTPGVVTRARAAKHSNG